MFDLVLWESHLAKFASRIIHLDKALDNIEQIDRRFDLLSKSLRSREINKKQLSRTAALRRFS